VSVAVLCNGAGAGATGYARQLATALIPDLAPPPSLDTVATDPAFVARVSGIYRSTRTHEPLFVNVAGGGRGGRGGTPAALRALRGGEHLLGNGRVVFDVGASGPPRGLRMLPADGDTVGYVFVSAAPWNPAAPELAAYEGRYHSPEVGATYTARVESGRLVLGLRAAVRRELNPAYKDAFVGPMGTVWFTRDARGRVDAMHVGAARVWDIVFRKTPDGG
jgi:hypothetical protein